MAIGTFINLHIMINYINYYGKSKVRNIINTHIPKEHGLNDLFAIMINGLMLSERNSFLNEDNTDGSKGNGYRKTTKSGIGSKLELSIPRDRMGVL